MRFYTSNFAKSGADPKAIAISQCVPKFYNGQVFKKLAPTWSLVKQQNLSPSEYEKIYRETVLDKLNPDDVAKSLGDGTILLCWESASKFCHRFIVAEWLRAAGHEVSEISVKFQSVKKTASPVVQKYDITGFNREQCEIVEAWKTYLTYPKNHNQAGKIRAQISKKLSRLSENEGKKVCEVLRIRNSDV